MLSSFVLSIVRSSWCPKWTYNTICVLASETQNKKSFYRKFPSKVNVFVTFVDKSHCNRFRKNQCYCCFCRLLLPFRPSQLAQSTRSWTETSIWSTNKSLNVDKVLRIIGPNSSRRLNYGLRSSMFGIGKFSRSQMLSEILRRNLAWKSWSCWQKK